MKNEHAYVVLSIGELRSLTRAAVKAAKKQETTSALVDRCVVIEGPVAWRPSAEVFQIQSQKLTARMAGGGFAFYPGDRMR